MMRMARPAHPGQFIRVEVIEPLDLSVLNRLGMKDLVNAKNVTPLLLLLTKKYFMIMR